jgi:hypothetical protein
MVLKRSETLLETPSGSGLAETPGKALLTISPQLQWFIYCSAVLQYTSAAQSSQPNSTSNYPSWIGPIWIAGITAPPPHGPFVAFDFYPYVVMFEATVGLLDLTNSFEEVRLNDTGYAFDIAGTRCVSWMFRSLDGLFPTQWLLGNSAYEPVTAAIGESFQVQNPGSPPAGPPYTYFFPGEGGEKNVSGFCVFPSPNFITNPAYTPPFYSGPGGPQTGTSILLNKAGTKGCIALHDYDAAHNLSPCDPSTIQVVNLTVDGAVCFNGPVSTVATGKALVFWIGLTPAQVPRSDTWPPLPAPQTFTAASQNLLTVQ